jgi:hypothetical protein
MSELTTTDRLAIHDTLYRYCHCLDRGRWEEFAALFTPDCCVDFSQTLGRYEGSAGVRQLCETLGSLGLMMRHLVTNIVIEGDGERAQVATYVLAVTGVPGPTQRTSTGFYQDELVKRDGRWLLHRRQLTLDVPPA